MCCLNYTQKRSQQGSDNAVNRWLFKWLYLEPSSYLFVPRRWPFLLRDHPFCPTSPFLWNVASVTFKPFHRQKYKVLTRESTFSSSIEYFFLQNNCKHKNKWGCPFNKKWIDSLIFRNILYMQCMRLDWKFTRSWTCVIHTIFVLIARIL